MSKTVSSKSPVKTNSMKMSVLRQTLFAVVMLAPLLMAGKKTSLPADRKVFDDAIRFTPGLSIAKSISISDKFYAGTQLDNYGISPEVFGLALKGFDALARKGAINADSILTIVDFSKSSREKRMVVVDLKNLEVLFHTVVAHGRNTGAEFAHDFSNQAKSHKSSLGFYVTRTTYHGSNGYSLKLDGQENGFNDRAMARAIVMHAADYASEEVIGQKGYLGRSWGCPALPEKINRKVIDKIKNGNALFVYFPDKKYLAQSKLLNG